MLKLKLDRYLQKRVISKNEFARLLNVPNSLVRTYFREIYRPKFATLSRWTEVLECKVEDLVETVPGKMESDEDRAKEAAKRKAIAKKQTKKKPKK